MATLKDKNVQFSEYTKHAADQLQNADTSRDQSLQRLQKIRNKRGKSQQRQLGRLATKYGDQHPRVVRQASRIASEGEMERYLDLSLKKSRGDTDIPKGSFVLEGRVLADNVKGLAGLTVQLQDARNRIIGKPAKTDKGGTYSLIVDVDAKLEGNKAIIVVLDNKGTQLHKEKLPAILKANSIESRDIVLRKVGGIDRGVGPILIKVKKPVIRKPVVREPIVKEPVIKKPVVKKKVVAKKAKKLSKAPVSRAKKVTNKKKVATKKVLRKEEKK
jgi:hypothetical protein